VRPTANSGDRSLGQRGPAGPNALRSVAIRHDAQPIHNHSQLNSKRTQALEE